ncbi:spore cortex biosynthesis protein YabQ [[Eubacterium] hominis]|uniref:spore cortex biosynthesis protein YabQ n=1 Tax=[Eubacterium] hominis TaxID=2764325 RepID=UPI003A4E47E3
MLLATQVQSILYHFLLGWIFAFGFSMLVSFKKAFRFGFLKAAMEFLYPIIFSAGMFYGLFYINGGITNLYLILVFLLGIMIYYRFYLAVFLQFFTGIKKLFRPFCRKLLLVKSKILGIIRLPAKAFIKRRRKNARKKRNKQTKKEETPNSDIL